MCVYVGVGRWRRFWHKVNAVASCQEAKYQCVEQGACDLLQSADVCHAAFFLNTTIKYITKYIYTLYIFIYVCHFGCSIDGTFSWCVWGAATYMDLCTAMHLVPSRMIHHVHSYQQHCAVASNAAPPARRTRTQSSIVLPHLYYRLSSIKTGKKQQHHTYIHIHMCTYTLVVCVRCCQNCHKLFV